MKVIKLKEQDIQHMVNKVINEDWVGRRQREITKHELRLEILNSIGNYDDEGIISPKDIMDVLKEIHTMYNPTIDTNNRWWFITHDHSDKHKEMKVVSLKENDIQGMVKKVLSEYDFKTQRINTDSKTGSVSWNVTYDFTVEDIYEDLDEIIHKMKRAINENPNDARLTKIWVDAKNLRNRVHRVITDPR